MSLLYIGAGLDTSILKADLKSNFFKNVNLFVFVDTHPFPENKQVDTEHTRRRFLKNLKKEMCNVGYKKLKRIVLKEKDDTVYEKGVVIFRSNKKFVYYFYSTTVDMITKNSQLDEFIRRCDILYVQGHNPGRDVISEMIKPISFIGGSQTTFAYDNVDDEHSLLANITSHVGEIDSWYFIDDDTFDITRTDYESLFCKRSPFNVDSAFFDKQSDFCMY